MVPLVVDPGEGSCWDGKQEGMMTGKKPCDKNILVWSLKGDNRLVRLVELSPVLFGHLPEVSLQTGI